MLVRGLLIHSSSISVSMSNLSTSVIISCSRFSNDFTLWNMKVRLSLRGFWNTVAFEWLELRGELCEPFASDGLKALEPLPLGGDSYRLLISCTSSSGLKLFWALLCRGLTSSDWKEGDVVALLDTDAGVPYTDPPLSFILLLVLLIIIPMDSRGSGDELWCYTV